MEGFSSGRLPASVRALLRDSADEPTLRLRHEAHMAESSAFWKSLDGDQLLFLAKMLMRITESESPASRASNYYGNAEILLHLTHDKCVCGEVHRDPDDLLQELVLKGTEFEAERDACDLYGLRRVPTHDFDGSIRHIYTCLGCGHHWDTLEQRREAGPAGACPGCSDHNNE